MDYKKMSFISGIAIFLSITILMITIITLSGKRIFFTRDYIIYVKFSDVIGLQDQAKVFLRGYRIGWTKDVKFREDGVVVRVDINKKYKIPDDSRFEINTITMLGEKAITIHPGKSKTFLHPGEIVEGQNKDIMTQAKEVLELVKQNVGQGELGAKAKKLSEAVDTLHSLLNTANTKVNQLDVAQYNKDIHHIGEAGKQAQVVLKETADSLHTSLAKFDRTLESLTRLSKELNQIATKINSGQGSAGALLNDKSYIQNLDSTIVELKELIADFKKNPKKYVKLSIF